MAVAGDDFFVLEVEKREERRHHPPANSHNEEQKFRKLLPARLHDAGKRSSHPGVIGEQRRQFVAAFGEEVRSNEYGIAALRPRPAFLPVLAVAKPAKGGGYGRGKRSLTGATPLAEWSWRGSWC